jgi:restriction system protein
MAETWRDYQEQVAVFFRGLGLDAQTNVTVQGVRTKHDIDVFVKSHHVGFDVIWIIECKHWTSRVTKLHVLALREIVADIGADRGILLAEAGFQSGSVEAATLTNVHVTSLAQLRNTARAEIIAMRLRELHDRVDVCRERYWSIPKKTRIEHGLRPDVGTGGYSGDQVINLISEIILRAFRAAYPVDTDSFPAGTTIIALNAFGHARQFTTGEEIISVVEPMIADLETRLTACETSHRDGT